MSQVAIQMKVLAPVLLLRRGRFPFLMVPPVLVAIVVAIFAIFGPVIAPHDPNAQDLFNTLQNPSRQFWLGTDDLGRDLASRIIAGARTAVVGPLLVAFGALVIGNALGLVSGYFGGRLDALIMRWVDLMYALPGLLVAIVLIGVVGGGYTLAVALLIVLTSPYDTRLVRGATLEQRPRPYVEAARALGLPSWRIMFWHIWPNVLPLVVANSFLNFAFSLVSLSALSFLGLGVGPGTPDWGRMLAENRNLLFGTPLAALAPAAMIVVTAASTNLIGDWLYELLSDRGLAR